jgi:hypothetical protein
MAESLAAAVARLDGRLTGIEARLDRHYAEIERSRQDVEMRLAEHYEITRESRASVDASLAKFEVILTRLVALSNEWAGVRKTLATAGAMIAVVSSIAGAFAAWLRYGSK